jgi:hypothetical protein
MPICLIVRHVAGRGYQSYIFGSLIRKRPAGIGLLFGMRCLKKIRRSTHFGGKDVPDIISGNTIGNDAILFTIEAL